MAIPFKKYGYQVNPITDEIETPKIFLVDKKLNKLGQLHPVDNLHITLNEVNQADEISFTYYKQTDGVPCPCFGQLDNLFIIQVEKFGFFEVTVNKEDSTSVRKSVSGISLGIAELSQILTSVEVNTDDDMNRDDYDVNYPTVFYREIEITDSDEIAERKRESSLLHRVLKRAPHYKIGIVSDTLKYVQRTFSWSDQDIISIFNDIAQEVNCVFDVHVTINEDGQVERIVNAYDVQYCDKCWNELNDAQKGVSSNAGQFRNIVDGVCQNCGSPDFIHDIGVNTNIFISTDSLSDNITIECDKDSIKNSFKIVGGDDLITNTVTGLSMSASDRIMLFSDYQKDQMSEELKQVYENYTASYNENKGDYARLLQIQYNIYDIIQYLQSGKMPILEEEITTTDMALYSTIKQISTYYGNCFYISKWSYYSGSFNSSYNAVRNLFTTFLPKGYLFTVDEDDKVITKDYNPKTAYLWYGTVKFYRTGDPDDYYKLHITKSGTYITHGKDDRSFRFDDTDKQRLVDNFRVQFEFGDQSQEKYMNYIHQYISYKLSSEVDLTYDNEKARHWEDYGLNPLKNYYSGFASCIESLDVAINEDNTDNEAKKLLEQMRSTYQKIQSDIAGQIEILEKQIFALCYYLGDFSSATNYTNEDGTISSQFQPLISQISSIFADMVNTKYRGGYTKSTDGSVSVNNTYNINRYIGDKPIKCNRCNSSYVSMTANGSVCNNKNCGSTDIYTYADMMKDVISEYNGTNHQIISELRQQYQDRFNIKKYINNDELYHELCSFIREDVYSNSNYISDGLTNAQLIEETQALITKAQQELAEACVPHYTITTPLCSVVAQTAFEYKGVLVNDDYSQFMINNYVHVKIDEELHTMRISSIDLEFPVTDKISVTFTNAAKGTGIMNDIASALSNAADMATSFSTVATQAEKGSLANDTFESIKNEGLDAALMSVKGGGAEQDVIMDEHGILLRRKIFETGEYSDCQMKLINRNIVLTEDNWKSAKMAIGYGMYNGRPVYGVWADLLCGDLTVTKELHVANDKGTVIIDENGITLHGGAITWTKPLGFSAVDGLNDFKNAVQGSLGVTEITEDSVISPKIGGGYLCIANVDYSVEIDPSHKAKDNKTNDGYLFCIRNKPIGNVIMGVDNNGDGYFSGRIEATSGQIGGWEIGKENGWLTASGSAGISWDSSDKKTHVSMNGDNFEMGRIEEKYVKIRMNTHSDNINNDQDNCFLADVGYISLKSKGNIILNSDGYIEIGGSTNEYFNVWRTTKFHNTLRLYTTNTDYVELSACTYDASAANAYLVNNGSMKIGYRLQVTGWRCFNCNLSKLCICSCRLFMGIWHILYQ